MKGLDAMLNRVMLQGRLAEVPELNHTANGTAVVRFSIAVEDSIETNGERKTYFFIIQAWQGTAELICKYFDKGQQIIVEGRLVSKTYTDKNDVKRKEVYIVADKIHFCGAKSREAQEKDFESDLYDMTSALEPVE